MINFAKSHCYGEGRLAVIWVSICDRLHLTASRFVISGPQSAFYEGRSRQDLCPTLCPEYKSDSVGYGRTLQPQRQVAEGS